MYLEVKNFGNITEGVINLEGITLLCGGNDTGKSTIGKALFSYCNVSHAYKRRILEQKANKLRDYIVRNSNFSSDCLSNNYIDFIFAHKGAYSIEEVIDYLRKHTSAKIVKDEIDYLVKFLNIADMDILNEQSWRYFNNIMSNQVKQINSKESCIVKGKYKDGVNEYSFTTNKCISNLQEPSVPKAYYINNPFILDYLNYNADVTQLPILERNVVEAIQQAQAEIEYDAMSNILEVVSQRASIERINSVLKKVYIGETIIENKKYYYVNKGVKTDFCSLSAGLKAFALIERLIMCGLLQSNDVLIIDAPETHLNPEWQLIYAELLVKLQKEYNLTILITTHSPYFLRAVEVYCDLEDRMNIFDVYSSVKQENGEIKLKNESYSEYGISTIYEKLFKPYEDLNIMLKRKL